MRAKYFSSASTLPLEKEVQTWRHHHLDEREAATRGSACSSAAAAVLLFLRAHSSGVSRA